MRLRLKVFILITLSIQLVFLCACSNSHDTKKENYKEYEGTWSNEGLEHQEIIENGGVEFCIKILNNYELEATLFSQQEISGRTNTGVWNEWDS